MPQRLTHHRDFISTSMLPVSQEHGENDSGSQRSRTVLQHIEEMGEKLEEEEEQQEVGTLTSSTAMAPLNFNPLMQRMAQLLVSWRTLYCVIVLSFMPFNLSAAIFAFWITSFLLLQILLVWEFIYSPALT